MQGQVDVVVVGAGFAGLAAARALHAAHRSVVVLEARDRVGGRSKSAMLNGRPMDVGGQWIGPGQDVLAALAAEFGIQTRPQFTAGRRILDLGGKMRRFKGDIPPLNPYTLLELGLIQRRIKMLERGIDLDAPWSSQEASFLDGQTVETFTRRHCRAAGARAERDRPLLGHGCFKADVSLVGGAGRGRRPGTLAVAKAVGRRVVCLSDGRMGRPSGECRFIRL